MKIVADGREYPFPENLEMGELRRLKRYFDLARPAVDLDLNNVDHVAGLLYVAVQRANSQLPVEAVIAKVDACRKVEFIPEEGDVPDEGGTPRPTEESPPSDESSETPGS